MTSPFTPEELVLIEVADQTASLRGQHHHHHHHHDHGHGHDDHHGHHHGPQFKAPQKLTTNLGLYALKKMQAINPRILSVKESRLLQPVLPGPITYFINAGLTVATSLYGVYLWRTRGFKGFATLGVVPLVGLFALRFVTMQGLSYIRDWQYYIQRKNMVEDFAQRYGESYLLNVLNPSFRM